MPASPTNKPRPFRFGVQTSGINTAREWTETARRAEARGYSCLTMPDHFDDQLAPVPALMAAAAEGIASMIGVERSMVEETPFALVGPTSKIIEDLLARRERWGFSYIIVGSDDIDSFAPVVEALDGR